MDADYLYLMTDVLHQFKFVSQNDIHVFEYVSVPNNTVDAKTRSPGTDTLADIEIIFPQFLLCLAVRCD